MCAHVLTIGLSPLSFSPPAPHLSGSGSTPAPSASLLNPAEPLSSQDTASIEVTLRPHWRGVFVDLQPRDMPNGWVGGCCSVYSPGPGLPGHSDHTSSCRRSLHRCVMEPPRGLRPVEGAALFCFQARCGADWCPRTSCEVRSPAEGDRKFMEAQGTIRSGLRTGCPGGRGDCAPKPLRGPGAPAVPQVGGGQRHPGPSSWLPNPSLSTLVT